jgi:putative membrane protein
MIGSTRVLWPWPNGTNTTTMSAPSDDVLVPVALIVVGTVVVIAVDLVATRFVTVEPLPEHERALEAEAAESESTH